MPVFTPGLISPLIISMFSVSSSLFLHGRFTRAYSAIQYSFFGLSISALLFTDIITFTTSGDNAANFCVRTGGTEQFQHHWPRSSSHKNAKTVGFPTVLGGGAYEARSHTHILKDLKNEEVQHTIAFHLTNHLTTSWHFHGKVSTSDFSAMNVYRCKARTLIACQSDIFNPIFLI